MLRIGKILPPGETKKAEIYAQVTDSSAFCCKIALYRYNSYRQYNDSGTVGKPTKRSSRGISSNDGQE